LTTRSIEGGGIEPDEHAREGRAAELDLAAIYRTFAGELSRFIGRLSGSAESADLLHEVFLVVQRRLPDFRGEASLKTWLYSIAVRVVVARRRKQRLRRLLWLERGEDTHAEPVEEETPETLSEGRQATRIVHAVLDRLSERDRSLIVLFELEGLPGEEIAAVLGTSENAVWVGLHRARARFRQQFSTLYAAEGGAR
jgi:RNA polymerase sigma-70 factor (ECF subfamily)